MSLNTPPSTPDDHQQQQAVLLASRYGLSLNERELWIRAHSRLGKIPVVLTLLGLSSSLECTTKPSNFPLWGEKVFFPASWRGLLNLQKGRPD